MINYDLIIFTPILSFYKRRLFSEVSRIRGRLLVVTLNGCSSIRGLDFVESAGEGFDVLNLSDLKLESGASIGSIFRTFKILRSFTGTPIIVSGWDRIEYWVVALIGSGKVGLALESSFYESSDRGLKGVMKAKFLGLIDLVLASGQPHLELVDKLGFLGRTVVTGGVGLPFNDIGYTRFPGKIEFAGRFLYVGRNSPEKNLMALIEAFKLLPDFKLTLAGFCRSEWVGPLPENVEIIGVFRRDNIDQVFNCNDVFVLPSLSEPWGLVVEEALRFGLPVIVSPSVGCSQDLVAEMKTGIVCDDTSYVSISKACVAVGERYTDYARNIRKINWSIRDKNQVYAYAQL
ncbi:MAG: glycosyltransferase family 4 protein [Oceanospirillaceae bacterium]|nr:glycosyltransferase family 4 protein [Oceanospirillaceae bacterium]